MWILNYCFTAVTTYLNPVHKKDLCMSCATVLDVEMHLMFLAYGKEECSLSKNS